MADPAAGVQQPAELHQPGVLLHVGRAALGAAHVAHAGDQVRVPRQGRPRRPHLRLHLAAGGGLENDHLWRRRRPRPDDERERDGRRAARRPRQRDDRRRPPRRRPVVRRRRPLPMGLLCSPLRASVVLRAHRARRRQPRGVERQRELAGVLAAVPERPPRLGERVLFMVLVRGGPGARGRPLLVRRAQFGAQFSARNSRLNSPTPQPTTSAGTRPPVPARRNSSGSSATSRRSTARRLRGS